MLLKVLLCEALSYVCNILSISQSLARTHTQTHTFKVTGFGKKAGYVPPPKIPSM
jgi:hypothetical protein